MTIIKWFKILISGKPHYIIGNKDNPYIKRWWLIPRNNWFNIYLHHILLSDDDRAKHDHRGHNISILLKNWYKEFTEKGLFIRKPGRAIFRYAQDLHRIELFNDATGKPIPVWSIFIVGPAFREWGFDCPQGWRHHEEFIQPYEGGNSISKGCD